MSVWRRNAVFLAGLGVILLYALALRWPYLGGGPGYLNHDEFMYVPKAIRYGGGDLNPHYFQNPPLMSYLMFAGHLAWYAAGRAAGVFESPLDFKAQYVADAAPAFVCARLLVLAIALGGLIHVAFLARNLAGTGASARARHVAGWAAALALAASHLFVLKSTTATNEMLVTVLYTLAVHAALRLAATPGAGAALLAGAVAGLCGGAKYTGALAALPVVAACLAAPDLRAAARIRLLLLAGASCVLTFLAVCPWVVLDPHTFSAHLVDLFNSRDRFQDSNGWLRYLSMAWGAGLGPVWFALGVAGLAIAGYRIAHGTAALRASRVVVVTAIVGMAAYLLPRDTMAIGRYLMPAFPCIVALAAAEFVTLPGRHARWGTRLIAGAALVWGAIALAVLPGRWREAALPDRRDAMAAFMKEHLPDGAYVIADVHAPWLPDWNRRREFEGKVPARTWAKLTPAFRLSAPHQHFRGPILDVTGTNVRTDDWPAIARLGPAYVVVTSYARDVFSTLPPGDYPGAAWHASVVRSLNLLHALEADSTLTPSVYLYAVPGN